MVMIIVTIATSVFMVEFLTAIAVTIIRFHRRQRRFFARLDARFCADLADLSLLFAAEILAEIAPPSAPAEDMQFAPPDWQNVASVTAISPSGGNQ